MSSIYGNVVVLLNSIIKIELCKFYLVKMKEK